MLDVKEIRVMISTQDLLPIRSFYVDLLGCTERVLKDTSDICMIEVGPGRVIEFFEEEGATSQGIEISLEVEDVQALWNRLQSAAPVVFPLRHNDWGDTSFAISDPIGSKLIFFTRDLDYVH